MADRLLYGYFRSSAAYRVRIALNLKGLDAETAFVHLRKGEQRAPAYHAVNPSGLVPTWREADGFTLSQSLAILEYLEEAFPEPALLPRGLHARAWAREIALTIACDIHPIGNLRVLDSLTALYGADTQARAAWNRAWIELGFGAIEFRLAETAGRHAVGDKPTLADICLVPQVYNARRFGVDMSLFPRLAEADAAAVALKAFAQAAPENQPDYEQG
jgi:maleylacetoacetate isomerase